MIKQGFGCVRSGRWSVDTCTVYGDGEIVVGEELLRGGIEKLLL